MIPVQLSGARAVGCKNDQVAFLELGGGIVAMKSLLPYLTLQEIVLKGESWSRKSFVSWAGLTKMPRTQTHRLKFVGQNDHGVLVSPLMSYLGKTSYASLL